MKGTITEQTAREKRLARRRKQREVVKARAKYIDRDVYRCPILGCQNPVRAETADGFDTRLCRKHREHLRTHGSAFKKSYPASVLRPYREKALRWLQDNSDDPWVSNANQRVLRLYKQAGPHVEAFRLTGLKPDERARAHWARLRKAEIDPMKVIAAWLSVELAILNDDQQVRSSEFKRVQGAKAVHRLASGSHKRWSHTELHVYPRSRGRVLRHIGEDLEGAVELMVPEAMKALL